MDLDINADPLLDWLFVKDPPFKRQKIYISVNYLFDILKALTDSLQPSGKIRINYNDFRFRGSRSKSSARDMLGTYR
jgi:hypothetical protein